MQKELSSFQKSVELIFQLEAKRAQLLRDELKQMPTGSLYIRTVSGKYYFDRKVDDNRTAVTHDLDIIYRLARKKYLQLKMSLSWKAFHTGMLK